MAMANKAEVELGQLGTSRASSPQVKSFAQMMVDEHTKANQQLMPVAQQLGVTEPSQLDGKHKAVAAKLSKASGAQFDQQFMRAMVEAHQDVLKQAQAMVARGSNSSRAAAGTPGNGGSSAGASGGSGSSSGSGAGGSGTSTHSGSSGSSATSGTSGSATSGISGDKSGASAASSSGSASSGGAPQSASEYAAATAPIIQHHLERAQEIEKSLGK